MTWLNFIPFISDLTKPNLVLFDLTLLNLTWHSFNSVLGVLRLPINCGWPTVCLHCLENFQQRVSFKYETLTEYSIISGYTLVEQWRPVYARPISCENPLNKQLHDGSQWHLFHTRHLSTHGTGTCCVAVYLLCTATWIWTLEATVASCRHLAAISATVITAAYPFDWQLNPGTFLLQDNVWKQ